MNKTLLSIKTRVEIGRANKIIGGIANKREVEKAIVFGRALVERQKDAKSSTKKRDAATRLSSALYKLRVALADRYLEKSLRDLLPVDQIILDVEELAQSSADVIGLDPPALGPKRCAVLLAADLLRNHGLPLSTTRKPKKSKFLLLAAVFYGDSQANLYRSCRDFMNDKFGTSLLLTIESKGPPRGNISTLRASNPV